MEVMFIKPLRTSVLPNCRPLVMSAVLASLSVDSVSDSGMARAKVLQYSSSSQGKISSVVFVFPRQQFLSSLRIPRAKVLQYSSSSQGKSSSVVFVFPGQKFLSSLRLPRAKVPQYSSSSQGKSSSVVFAVEDSTWSAPRVSDLGIELWSSRTSCQKWAI